MEVKSDGFNVDENKAASLELYLKPTLYIDSDNPAIQAFAASQALPEFLKGL